MTMPRLTQRDAARSDDRRTERWILRVILALGAASAVALGIGLTQTRSLEPSVNGQATGDARVGVERYDVAERAPMPELSGRDLDGARLATSDFTGQVLVLNVWGSWCSPCREEAPALAQLARATAAEPVRFIGLDTRDNVGSAQAFVRGFEIPYPSFDDRDGEVLRELTGIVPVNAVPSTVFVDSRGQVAARVIGPVDAATLEGIIDDLLAEERRGST